MKNSIHHYRYTSGRHCCNGQLRSFYWRQSFILWVYPLAEDPKRAERDHQNWFQIILFLTQTSSFPLSIICLQLRDGVLVVLISVTGIIAVMIGFAGNMDRHVKTSTISDWRLWKLSQADAFATYPRYNLCAHQINFL